VGAVREVGEVAVEAVVVAAVAEEAVVVAAVE
jgi:hypothetical protein